MIAGTRLLCTPYAPDARATAAARTGRDRLIHALSRLTVVVATEPSGDPWTGAVAAIDAGFTVAVWRGPGEGDGNAALEAHGATAHPIGGRAGAVSSTNSRDVTHVAVFVCRR